MSRWSPRASGSAPGDHRDRAADRNRRKRTEDSRQLRAHQQAGDEYRGGDSCTPAVDERLKHVVLDLLIGEKDSEHDQRRNDALCQSNGSGDSGRDCGADQGDEVQMATTIAMGTA